MVLKELPLYVQKSIFRNWKGYTHGNLSVSAPGSMCANNRTDKLPVQHFPRTGGSLFHIPAHFGQIQQAAPLHPEHCGLIHSRHQSKRSPFQPPPLSFHQSPTPETPHADPSLANSHDRIGISKTSPIANDMVISVEM